MNNLRAWKQKVGRSLTVINYIDHIYEYHLSRDEGFGKAKAQVFSHKTNLQEPIRLQKL